MIYVRGDTHGFLSCFSDPALSGLTAEDKLIITGDFGFLLRGDESVPAEKAKLDALAKMPFEILFLDGNHENFDALETYPEVLRYGAPVRQLRHNLFWLRRGHVYTIEGRTFFVMGGGYSLDKADRLANDALYGRKSWFPQEMPSADEYRRAIDSLQAHNLKVDYILTHTAPRVIIAQIINRTPDPHERELNSFLDWIYQDVSFRKWYFGHLHMDMALYGMMVACLDTVHRLDD